ARETLDAWTRQMMEWHFNPETGCPFWLDYAAKLGWDPRREIRSYDDLGRLGPFQDGWLRGGPVSRWVPRGLAGKPIYVFETGGHGRFLGPTRDDSAILQTRCGRTARRRLFRADLWQHANGSGGPQASVKRG